MSIPIESRKMVDSAEESSPAAYTSEACCICNEEFTSDIDLTNHLIDHTNEDKFKTRIAELQIPNGEQSLNTPIRVVGNRTSVPEFTRTSFVREPPLRKKPDNTPTEPEVWEIVSDDDSNDNQESNTKKAKLSNSFRLVSPGSTPNSLSESGPPFHCHSCSSAFNDPVTFREHLLTHDKPRPYVCHICKKSFAYKGTLRQHLHLHISERSHECRVCHKKFSIKSVLRKHEESHEMQQIQEQRNNSRDTP